MEGPILLGQDGDSSLLTPKISARSMARGKRERPCDGCRRRKGRCVPVEGQSQCAACAVHNHPCTYVEDPKPRKRKTDSGASTSPVSAKKKSHTYPPVGVTPATALQPLLQGVTLASDPKATATVAQLPQSSPVPMTDYIAYIGPTTEYEPELIRMSSKISDAGIGAIQDFGKATFLVHDPQTSSTHSMTSALQATLKPHLARMAELYRRVVHDHFPILDDETIASLQSGSMAGCDTLVTAAMFLAVAPWYEKQDETLLLARNDRNTLEGFTFGLFTQSLYHPNLRTVQAGLLLMQSRSVDTKALNNQLSEVTYELGLNLDCSLWEISAREKALRRRLAWAVYVQDKWCALIHGRPSSISTSNWAVNPLSEKDFSQAQHLPEDAEARKRRQDLYMQMVRLTQILSEILSMFFSVSAMRDVESKGSSGLRYILERVKRVQVPLKEWFSSLPSTLRMESHRSSGGSRVGSNLTSRRNSAESSNVSSPNASAGFLHLAYYATEITLHRCIIRSQPSDPLVEPALVGIVRTAAKERLISALEFANRLRSPALAGFWYFPARLCFAVVGTFGALLAATAPAREEADFYVSRLREFRWTLAVARKDAPWLAHAAKNLDAQLILLAGVPTKPEAKEIAEKREAKESRELAARRARGSDLGASQASRMRFDVEDLTIEEEVLIDDDDEMDEDELEELEAELEAEDDGEGEMDEDVEDDMLD